MLRVKNPIHRYALAAATAILVQVAPAAAQSLTEADLAALRYFLATGDQKSVEAEKRRLQAEFPAADIEEIMQEITTVSSDVDTTEIWRLIANDSFTEARELIARERQANPGWIPPADMMAVLGEREGQLLFDSAMEDKDVNRALELVNTYADLLTCGRINNAWRLAQLQSELSRTDEAITTYTGILNSCNSRDFVIATLQKAAPITTQTSFDALMTLARANNPTLAGRLDTLEEELRPLIGRGSEVAAGPTPGQSNPVPSADYDSNGKITTTGAPPTRPSGLGTTTTANTPPPRTNTGVTTGGGVGGGGGSRLAAATAAADRKDFGRCLELTANPRTPEMQNQRAWCAFNLKRPLEAVRLFVSAMNGTRSASLRGDAAYGAMLAYIEAGMVDEALQLSRRVNLTPEHRRTTDVLIMTRLAQQSFDRKNYRDTVQYIDRLSRVGALDRGLAMLRGFALLHLGRRSQALAQFQAVHRTSPGQDTIRVIGQLRAGN